MVRKINIGTNSQARVRQKPQGKIVSKTHGKATVFKTETPQPVAIYQVLHHRSSSWPASHLSAMFGAVAWSIGQAILVTANYMSMGVDDFFYMKLLTIIG